MAKIRDIFHGNSSPIHDKIRKGSEYERLSQAYLSLSHTFLEMLSPEQKQLFNQVTDLQGQMGALDAEECYVRGFRDGAAVLLDVLGCNPDSWA